MTSVFLSRALFLEGGHDAAYSIIHQLYSVRRHWPLSRGSLCIPTPRLSISNHKLVGSPAIAVAAVRFGLRPVRGYDMKSLPT